MNIIVGYEQREAFESTCRIIQSGILSTRDSGIDDEPLNARVERNKIIAGSYTYELADRRGGRSEDNDILEMDVDGAGWFRGVKGEASVNEGAEWIAFTEEVARKYHKRYSLIEYKQRPRDRREAEKNRKECEILTRNVLATFYPSITNIAAREVGGDEGVEDYYGLNLRIELSGGTGAEVPILCRAYFKRRKGKMSPVRSMTAASIENYLEEVSAEEANKASAKAEKENNNHAKQRGDREDGIIDNALNALNDLVNGRGTSLNFSEIMYFANESDENTLDDLVGRGANGVNTLECKSVKVLGISHVKWESYVYDIVDKASGNVLFRVTMGLNNSLSMYCRSCANDEMLIDNNIIRCVMPETGDVYNFTIDPTKSGLGLDEEDMEYINEGAAFNQHQVVVRCPENTRNRNCSRNICASQLLTLETKEGPKQKCSDCPYPEIIYTCRDNVKRYTPELAFAKDEMTMIEREDVAKCGLCGRLFSASGISGNRKLCALCREAESPAKEGSASATAAIEAYKRYGSMLPLHTRIASGAGKKYCYEDDEVLLFVVGKNKYIFNKLDVKDDGFIPAPKKLN